MLRGLLTLYVVVLNAVRFEDFARPGLALALVGVLLVWSALATWAYDVPQRRTWLLYGADVGIAVALIAATPLVQSDAMMARQAATLPSFWVAVPVLAVSAGLGWLPALVAAVAVSATDLAVREEVTGGTWGNILLLTLAAGVVGYAAQALREAAVVRAAAERAAATYAERARLSRAVHDGVLQVLALVQRADASDPEGLAALRRIAAEQEGALRSLIHEQSRGLTPEAAADRRADLAALLAAVADGATTVSSPEGPVMVPEPHARDIAAAVAEAIANTRRHVGESAPVWILVEDLGREVVVSVRDEGPGIAPGRLERAAADGRLGVSESIRGRLHDLGGHADLITGPDGTEWELHLPKEGT